MTDKPLITVVAWPDLVGKSRKTHAERKALRIALRERDQRQRELARLMQAAAKDRYEQVWGKP